MLIDLQVSIPQVYQGEGIGRIKLDRLFEKGYSRLRHLMIEIPFSKIVTAHSEVWRVFDRLLEVNQLVFPYGIPPDGGDTEEHQKRYGESRAIFCRAR